MSDKAGTQPSPPTIDNPPKPTSGAKNAAPKGNPAFKALGLPNLRLRLPSRNWMIFITVVGSWTGTLVYDRWQKKKVQKKWCTLVEHIASEPMSTDMMARKMTIILAGPPGDRLSSTREHFTEYVKPVLVAAAMDWDVIEGRREGDVRAGLAERIRRYRRRKGETAETEMELDSATILDNSRARAGITEFDGIQGDIVIGRHTWKEYVRGMHEGWLGSIDPPKVEEPLSATPAAEETPLDEKPVDDKPAEDQGAEPDIPSSDDAVAKEAEKSKEEPKEEPKKPEKPKTAPPYNTPASYSESQLPQSIPFELGPASPIPFPHILGFLNTPVRMYRFLTRRHLADDVGRQTAAAVLAAHRPFREENSGEPASDGQAGGARWEQQDVLAREENQWYKAARQRKEDDGEREWIDEVVIDPRIGQRMRRFEVEPGDEERAKAIWRGAKGLPGRREGDDGGLERDEK